MSAAASSAKSRKGAAARTAACFSTSAGSRPGSRMPPSTSRRSCRACTTSSSSSPISTSRRSRWRSDRRRTTSWGACGSTRTRRCRHVPGLFAAGECAAGINGANRLGGNSLSDILVFGKRAGEFAAKFAKSRAGRDVRRAASRRGRSSGARAVRPRDRRARVPIRCSTRCRR